MEGFCPFLDKNLGDVCGPSLELFQAVDTPGPLVLSLESGVSVLLELNLSPGLPLSQPFTLSECWSLHLLKVNAWFLSHQDAVRIKFTEVSCAEEAG